MLIIADCFPFLEELVTPYIARTVSRCTGISDEGICEVLRCCKIRHLNLAHSFIEGKLLGLNFEIPKLEVLNLSHTNINDETLNVISKNCRGLLQLLLEQCNYYVTEKGVKHVGENCLQLREINLKGCLKVDHDVVASLVFSRPSLRKITAPSKGTLLASRMSCLLVFQNYSSEV
ncbi:putative leucine-rich repeat domain, L domain-containing protein [Medicago truncatula]|uniref:F-box/RNI superfamily protein n=1 Tax=Medicago truncatula TaxID=3880 RepID=A0A072UG19_MEDTR|nr:F-box/RNI superfamily protein [Medicago truncatula]RHN58446.1 putative leucine-rich repeat domain, L domain-containing protein [Medicago truncatula]